MENQISGYILVASIVFAIVIGCIAADRKYQKETGKKPEYIWNIERDSK